ncbi:hypothetical protein LY76DRAFT_654458 [Colletotrichum caudatum]|nr:hypothetical protein LY76DRAFT_654458 [Colletotrichum caudatum]
MRSPMLLVVALVTSVLGQILNPALGQFIDPSKEGETWKVGEKKKIVFNTTLRHYTVGLWQQASPSAVLGGIAFRMVDAEAWGIDGNQGNQTLRHIFSASFTISNANPAGGSTPSRTSTTRQGPTKTVVLSKTAPAQTTVSPLPLSPGQPEGVSSADPSTTSGKLPVGTVEDSGPTRTAGERWPASTGSDRALHVGEADSSGSSAGLPVGTKAGIGVGVGAFSIACIACAVMLYQHLKTKQRALAEARESSMAEPPPYFHGMALSPVSPVSPVSAVQPPTKSTPGATGFYVNLKPVEIA